MRVDLDAIYGALAGDDEGPGVFERVLGFGTSTGVIKGVHVMNDLAQSVLGGAPEHGGDLLCHVVREDKSEGEDNSDAALRADPRFGAAYARAFPATMSPAEVSRLRHAAATLLTFDGGIYKPGTRMASALATHRDLLGFEGFRRFGVGRYLAAILDEAGRARLAQALSDASDPFSRALGPLRLAAPLREDKGAAPPALTPLDRALGARVATLLGHPLTKATLLRYVLLLGTLGVSLKLLGAGRKGGTPFALATTADESAGRRPARQEAVQAFARGVAAFYERVAAELPHDPRAARIVAANGAGKRGTAEVEAEDLVEAAPKLLQAWRDGALKGLSRGSGGLYAPEDFVISLGRKAGLILPRTDQAGWGKQLALTTDAVEALVLSSVPAGAPPVAWVSLWAGIRDELGLVIGAGDFEDARFLTEGGVLHLDLDGLARNSEAILTQATRRGVARRLPDSGAEAGGSVS